MLKYGTTAAVDSGSEPAELALLPGAPNPAAGSTVITYRIPAASEVSLKLYDPLGRELRTLAAGSEAAGTHEVRLSTEGLPVGAYFYRLNVDGRALTRTLLVRR